MDTFWNRIPRALAENLLSGSVGRTHLTSIGYQCIELSKNDPANRDLYIRMAFETLLSAWCNDPLNRQSAELQLNLMGPDATGSPLGMIMARIIKANKGHDYSAQEKRIRSLIGRERFEQAAVLFKELISKTEANIALLSTSLKLYEISGEDCFLNSAGLQLENIDFTGLEPLAHFLRANLAFAREDYNLAAAEYSESLKSGAFPVARPRLAESMLHIGKKEDAVRHYLQDSQTRFWHLNSLLRAADLTTEMDLQSCPPPGRVAILIYSYNKASELDATLEAVFAARYENAFLAVLDNGSSDETAAVIDKWEAAARQRDDLPLKRFDLHVNIGAPAARNWLLYHPQLAEADFAAFLDDDALPPQDWLHKLGAAINKYPKAGVWGCKVVDAHNPRRLQSTDLHLKAAKDQQESSVRMTDIQLQTMDYGQFDYVRPCASVTGCCHIMRLADLDRTGGFDLRFSPSQFDDLDRDLRLCLQNMLPVYQGHLRVKHMKRTGAAGAVNKQTAAIQISNQARLDMKYSLPEVRAIRNADYEISLADVTEKIKLLRN